MPAMSLVLNDMDLHKQIVPSRVRARTPQGGGEEGWSGRAMQFSSLPSLPLKPVPVGSSLHPYLPTICLSLSLSPSTGPTQGLRLGNLVTHVLQPVQV